MAIAADIINQARAVPIERVVRLKGRGRWQSGPCSVCGGVDRFWINTKKQAWGCRNCGTGGDVIALAMHVHGVDFRGAIELLTGGHAMSAQPQRQAPARNSPPQFDDDAMLARADDIWRAALPIGGTPGATYLTSRGIDLGAAPDHGGLRFHPACPYGPGRTLPCVIARFTDARTGAERGIHRRAITAGIEPKTMTLGPMGGAVVRLWPDEDVMRGLVIGEGVETVLAAATRIQHRGTLLQPAWACGMAGNLENFPALPGIEALTILADADVSGRGQEAAARCAERWADADREVMILTPNDLGADFNDMVAL